MLPSMLVEGGPERVSGCLWDSYLCSKVFQPMWGTGSPREVSNFVTLPGITPRPSTPPFSSLPSNSSCMPRQIPRKGFPACKRQMIMTTASCRGIALCSRVAWLLHMLWRRHESQEANVQCWIRNVRMCMLLKAFLRSMCHTG